MRENTKELIKKFEDEHEILVGATDAQTYWIIYARVQRSNETTHHLHHGRKFVSGPGMDGSVLVLRDPFISDQYSVESWGKMDTIDDFVKKALAQLLVDKNAADRGESEECGTGCV
jgi:hypothetical protein